jgi:hypothetical protein
MPFRSLAAALALVFAVAAVPSASAQHVVYHAPVVYHQPAVSSTPVVYHQPVYTSGTPWVQSGQWVNRPNLLTPESNRPLSRPLWDTSGRDGFGVPFNNRPGLNIAYRLAWR